MFLGEKGYEIFEATFLSSSHTGDFLECHGKVVAIPSLLGMTTLKEFPPTSNNEPSYSWLLIPMLTLHRTLLVQGAAHFNALMHFRQL